MGRFDQLTICLMGYLSQKATNVLYWGIEEPLICPDRVRASLSYGVPVGYYVLWVKMSLSYGVKWDNYCVLGVNIPNPLLNRGGMPIKWNSPIQKWKLMGVIHYSKTDN